MKLESPGGERIKSEWCYNEENSPADILPPANVWQANSGASTKIAAPVSYTHLDVYKRQTLVCVTLFLDHT